MQMAKVSAEDIDMIIFATLTLDMIIPSAACVLQANLRCQENAAAYDLQAACSGFVYGLITAASYISSGLFKKVLVVGAEILSSTGKLEMIVVHVSSLVMVLAPR